jgi:glycerol kinase
VDGGAAVNNLLMQIQADVLGRRVVRPEITETTALGAAFLAGLASGYWSGIDQLQEQWKVNRSFTPAGDPDSMRAVLSGWEKALARSRNWSNNSD